MSAMQHASAQPIFCSIKQHLALHEFAQAAQMLIAEIEFLLQHYDHPSIAALLAALPAEQFDADPDLLWTRSLVYLAAEDLEKAAPLLHRASLFYLQNDDLRRTADCYCALVTIYQHRENFSTAYLYIQETELLLAQMTEPKVKATLCLRLAELCPDIGRLHESLAYAKEALDYFRTIGQGSEQFKALLLLAIVYRQLGRYQEAAARLEMAEQVGRASQMGNSNEVALLNAAAHLAWYQGNRADASTKAQAFSQLARQHNLAKQQIYSMTLLGNLQRSLGDFAAAADSYQEARHLVNQFAFHLYLPWIDVHEGWLKVLTGDYAEARHLIHKALETADHGQMMSFNVNLAALNILTARFYTARDLLQISLAFYTQSGDELATTVVRLYLGLIDLKTDALITGRLYIQTALNWLNEHRITYFPHWWHPQLMSEICAFALAENIHPLLAERILIQQIGAAAIDHLQPLRAHQEASIRERVENILELFNARIEITLDHIKDEPVKETLATLLRQGWLRRDGFMRLQDKLRTAQHHEQRSNPVLMAVFGLYTRGYAQGEIAARLGRAEASVRNYITIIYQIFVLPQAAFSSHTERKRALVTLAQRQGFIAKGS